MWEHDKRKAQRANLGKLSLNVRTLVDRVHISLSLTDEKVYKESRRLQNFKVQQEREIEIKKDSFKLHLHLIGNVEGIYQSQETRLDYKSVIQNFRCYSITKR